MFNSVFDISGKASFITNDIVSRGLAFTRRWARQPDYHFS